MPEKLSVAHTMFVLLPSVQIFPMKTNIACDHDMPIIDRPHLLPQQICFDWTFSFTPLNSTLSQNDQTIEIENMKLTHYERNLCRVLGHSELACSSFLGLSLPGVTYRWKHNTRPPAQKLSEIERRWERIKVRTAVSCDSRGWIERENRQRQLHRCYSISSSVEALGGSQPSPWAHHESPYYR